MRSKEVIFLVIVLFLPLLTLSGVAQGVPDEDIFQTALAITNENCEGLRRNEACYGHALLSAVPHLGVSAFNFENEGDRVHLAATQSIKLSGLDVDAGTWGVVLMQLRANLPSSQLENVTLVAFGDVEITNAVRPHTQARLQVQTRENVNVRFYPSPQARVIGTLKSDQTVTAIERLADSTWLRVQMPDSDETGWVFAELLTSIDDIEGLNISESQTPYFEPMQAFYFSSGSEAPEFTEVPNSGLLIQTPEGVGEVNLLINEINVQLGSTVFFQAQPDGMMAISTLEGHADISVGGVEQTAFDGTIVRVQLDANLKPQGAPAEPKPYDENSMKSLPLDSLKRKIDVHPARTEEEITRLIEEQEANETESGGTQTESPIGIPNVEVTPELTPEVVLSVEVTPEVTPSAESTPEVTPSEQATSEVTPEEDPSPEVISTEEGATEVPPTEENVSDQGTSSGDMEDSPDEEATPEPGSG